jgi:hypothetical protein
VSFIQIYNDFLGGKLLPWSILREPMKAKEMLLTILQ